MQASMHHESWRPQGSGCEMGYLDTTSRFMEMRSVFDFGERTSEDSLHSPRGSCFLLDDAKRREATTHEARDYAVTKSNFYTDEAGHDLFDMSSFFREHETLKLEAHDLEHLTTEFDEGQIHSSTTDDQGECVLAHDPQNESSDTVAETVMDVSDSSVDSVVMGIPYYVACQWQQMQQQQQQQQQAVMMLWWQAYLSGAYNMIGPKNMNATQQLGWSLPTTGLAAFHGTHANFGEDAFYQQMLMMDDKGQATSQGTKRRRKNDGTQSNDLHPNSTKKGRRPRHDERVCKNCGTNETPFWRKDKNDGLPLCNACGLYLSKNDAPRPKVLWKTAERPMAPPAAAVPVAAANAALIA